MSKWAKSGYMSILNWYTSILFKSAKISHFKCSRTLTYIDSTKFISICFCVCLLRNLIIRMNRSQFCCWKFLRIEQMTYNMSIDFSLSHLGSCMSKIIIITTSIIWPAIIIMSITLRNATITINNKSEWLLAIMCSQFSCFRFIDCELLCFCAL